MSSSSASIHTKCFSSEAERGQMLLDVEAAQQRKLRERQRFFEEVFQHDVDVFLSSAHLCIRDYKRTPIGSISSMEVNVDMLDQMDQIDISDPDGLDVFVSSGEEEETLTSRRLGNSTSVEGLSNGLYRHVLEDLNTKSRTLSASSDSSVDSQTISVNGPDTPVFGSEDEEVLSNTANRRTESPEDQKCQDQL